MSEGRSAWLESELVSKLGPVEAPLGLWERIQHPAAAPSRPVTARFLWPAIAIILLLASADLLWEFSKARGGLRQMAQPDASDIAAIASAPDRCDLYSDDPARIRQWVKSRTGIDIELPQHTSSVRVLGARVVDFRGTLVATVAYESGERTGTMLVWKNGRGNSQTAKHVFARQADRSVLVSWTRGENTFAVASSAGASPNEACLLCHPEGGHGI
ncbi:MAG TPA: hypothetical protein VNH18_37230 [Bryobacteraceae bacterium]|nr:hypothetical protein [Bryobacteraceae bacterium]